MVPKIYFSDVFGVDERIVDEYGAFDISLVNDIPVFIDPFRLYASDNLEYRKLHEDIIRYLRFLRDYCAEKKVLSNGELLEFFCFHEVRNIFMGFCEKGNSGRGLGKGFATALQKNLSRILNFGEEKISDSSHLEKLCVVCDKVGRDCISDFTANLIKGYLLDYTQTFAKRNLSADKCETRDISNAVFDYEKKIWKSQKYYLPIYNAEPVILVPRDFLTRDDTWICKAGMIKDLRSLPTAMPDEALRDRLQRLLVSVFAEDRKLSERERNIRLRQFCHENPEVVDWYIKRQEERKAEEELRAKERVATVSDALVCDIKNFVYALEVRGCYKERVSCRDDALNRILYFKDVIEKNDGYRMFDVSVGRHIREEQLQKAFRLVWYDCQNDLNSEVNNGRGPADFVVSYGANEKCVIEFKLASNTKLEDNLMCQLDIYKAANGTKYGLCVIAFTSDQELERMDKVLAKLGLSSNKNIIPIDVRPKRSASKMTQAEFALECPALRAKCNL